MKVCSTCKEAKSHSDFHSDKSTYDGFRADCKACRKAKLDKKARSERDKRYYSENRERKIATVTEWAKKNPERMRVITANKDAVRRQLIGNAKLPTNTYDVLVSLYGEGCMNPDCTTPDARIEIDHVIPLSLNGAHHMDNLQLLCRSCNASKGNRNTNDYRPTWVSIH